MLGSKEQITCAETAEDDTISLFSRQFSGQFP